MMRAATVFVTRSEGCGVEGHAADGSRPNGRAVKPRTEAAINRGQPSLVITKGANTGRKPSHVGDNTKPCARLSGTGRSGRRDVSQVLRAPRNHVFVDSAGTRGVPSLFEGSVCHQARTFSSPSKGTASVSMRLRAARVGEAN